MRVIGREEGGKKHIKDHTLSKKKAWEEVGEVK